MSSFPPIDTVLRALQVLEEMNHQAVTTVNHLHLKLGLPRPSIVRTLQTLEYAGYVTHSRRGAYMLTSRVKELSAGLHGEPKIVEKLGPMLDELTADIKWPTAIAVADGNAVRVCYSTIPASPLSLLQSTVGKRLSLVSRALGRAYLAHCEASVRETLLDLAAASDDDENLVARDRKAVLATLAAVRASGYAVRAPGVRPVSKTLAVPVFEQRRVVAAIGVTWFASTLTVQEAVKRYLQKLQAISARFEE